MGAGRGSRTFFPRVGWTVGEGPSGSCGMEEMRELPVESAGLAGTLQSHPPPFEVFLLRLGGKQRSSTLKT